MFRQISSPAGSVLEINFEGKAVRAYAGETVAAALLRYNQMKFRNADANNSRGPYCMMGTCFECLVQIDGTPNQQACQAIVHDGMTIERQSAPLTSPIMPNPSEQGDS